MNEDFVNQVSKIIQQFKKDLAAFDGVIREAEGQRSRVRDQLTLFEQSLAVYRQVMDLPRTPQEQLPLVGGLRGTIAEMSAQIMEAKGGSATVRELVDILKMAGKFKNPDKDRLNYGTVFGTLQRDERFGKVPGKGEFYLVRLLTPDSPPSARVGGQEDDNRQQAAKLGREVRGS